MSEVRYGPVQGMTGLKVYEMPVAATQYFNPTGTFFCYLDSSGHVVMAITATQYLFGWVFAPTSFDAGSTAATNGYFTSSSTAAATKLLVAPFVANPGMVMRVKVATGLAVRARVGEVIDLVGVNDGTAQYADTTASTNDLLSVVDLPSDGDTNTILVVANPLEVQKDT
jgi:hypothetical protein